MTEFRLFYAGPRANALADKGSMENGKKKKPRTMQGFFYAELTGLEPATSCVTGRRSNQTELQLH
jgi:hypothetical protein